MTVLWPTMPPSTYSHHWTQINHISNCKSQEQPTPPMTISWKSQGPFSPKPRWSHRKPSLTTRRTGPIGRLVASNQRSRARSTWIGRRPSRMSTCTLTCFTRTPWTMRRFRLRARRRPSRSTIPTSRTMIYASGMSEKRIRLTIWATWFGRFQLSILSTIDNYQLSFRFSTSSMRQTGKLPFLCSSIRNFL